MARLRKASAYSDIERPYTRHSKYKKENYVKSKPHSRVTRFENGNANGDFDKKVNLICEEDVQIRDNALESARQAANQMLEDKLGSDNYFLRVRKYPFHVLRENPMATGAGADRMSQGMQLAFGKPIGLAAQVPSGDIVIEIRVDEKDLELAQNALKQSNYKLPGSCKVVTEE